VDFTGNRGLVTLIFSEDGGNNISENGFKRKFADFSSQFLVKYDKSGVRQVREASIPPPYILNFQFKPGRTQHDRKALISSKRWWCSIYKERYLEGLSEQYRGVPSSYLWFYSENRHASKCAVNFTFQAPLPSIYRQTQIWGDTELNPPPLSEFWVWNNMKISDMKSAANHVYSPHPFHVLGGKVFQIHQDLPNCVSSSPTPG